MSEFKLTATVNRFEQDRWTKALDEEALAVFKEAARQFLVAALRRIPIRTGFLAGAFSTLEDLVGALSEGGQRTAVGNTRRTGTTNRKGALDQRKPGSVLKNTQKQRNRLLARAQKLDTLRKEQAKALASLAALRQREARRHIEIAAALENARQQSQKAGLSPSQHQAAIQPIRRQAILDRKKRLELIRESKNRQAQITKISARVEKDFGLSRATLQDRTIKVQLALEKAAINREKRFFSQLKNIDKQYLANQIGGDVRERLIDNARSRLNAASKREKLLQGKLDARIAKRASKLPKAKLAAIQKAIIRRAKRQAARTGESASELTKQGLLRTLSKIDTKHSSSKFVQLLNETNNRETQDFLRQQQTRKEKLERLNVVFRVRNVRTGQFTIRGQRQDGSPDLRHNEVAITELNKKKLDGGTINPFQERYYHIKGGGKGSATLKNPRSGRLYSTPAGAILTRVSASTAKFNLFAQTLSIMRASGVKIDPKFAKAAGSIEGAPGEYIFNYSVAIKYLAVNDIKQGWQSWNAGVLAFRRHLTLHIRDKLPTVQEYTVTETVTQVGTSSNIRSVMGKF